MTQRFPVAGELTARPRKGRGLRARLRDARIQSKLGLILVIPVLAVLGLAAARIVDRGQQAMSADLVRSLTALSADASAVSHELHRERMSAASFLATPGARPDEYIPQIARSDEAIGAYRADRAKLGGVPATVNDRLVKIDQQLDTLDAARQEVLTRKDMTVSGAVLRYGTIIHDLTSYRDVVGQIAGDTPLGDQLRASAALSKTKEQMSEAQAVAFVALQSGHIDEEQLTAFLHTLTTQEESLDAFLLSASAEQREIVNSTITGDAVTLADQTSSDVIRSANREQSLVTAAAASRSLGAIVDLVRWVEQRIDTDLLAAASDLRASVIRQVVIESVAVLVILILAIAFALALARNLVRSLSRLREGALTVATRDLPQTVAKLSDPMTLGEYTPEDVAAQVLDPIQLNSQDEIGQVAQAFNVVHREAVRVAAEQAALNTSVSAMFLNLARRSQTLVDLMIAQLDDIERNEEDAKRLARLFQLDHLATRMRRNDENLLVLAGADSSPARREDGAVVDILRAAQSEIEHYNRIEFGTVDMDVSVAAIAVNDVVRLLAELFDNATRFSPPDSAVIVEARRVGHQLIVQVEDRGVGVAPEQAEKFNARLAAPPAIDITAFRMMGLAVVGRLAARYQIRVELRGEPGKGTAVSVTLPTAILILPRTRGFDLRVSRPRLPLESAPAPLVPPQRSLQAAPAPAWHGLVHNNNNHAVPVPLPPVSPISPVVGGPPMQTVVDVATREHPTFTAEDRSILGVPAPQYSSAIAADDTTELPIFREMEAKWFRSHGKLDMGTAPPPASSVSAPPAPAPAAATYVPSRPPTGDPSEMWRTAADDGWRAAAAAAEPVVRTTTRSGLPKRVPEAQLVPGGVGAAKPSSPDRRSPEDVKGLLSAYHRGVQRGRSGGDR